MRVMSVGAKALHPDVDWARIARFRNVLTHGYRDINLETVRSVMREEMPALRAVVTSLRS